MTTTTAPRDRARPLPPDERRAAILAAARPLVLEHGRGTTTKQIAAAAGVAEGTLFRVFATKDDIFDALLQAEADFGPFLDALGRVRMDQSLEARLTQGVTLLQERFAGVFAVMTALGCQGPPRALAPDAATRKRLQAEGLERLLAPDAERFDRSIGEVVWMLRMLTFSGTHPHLSDQGPMTAAQVVDVVLHGTLDRSTGWGAGR